VAIREAYLAGAIPLLGNRPIELGLSGYTPCSRATIEARAGRCRVAVKAYAKDAAPEAGLYEALATAGLSGDTGVRVPPLLAWDCNLRVLVIGWLEGPTAEDLVKGGHGERAGELAARWLQRAALLPVKLGPPLGATQMLGRARKWVAAVNAVDPTLETAATRLAAKLEQTQPQEGAPRLVHGTLHARHILDCGAGPGVIDWQYFGQGPLELDAGIFLASIWPLGVRYDPLAPEAARAEEAFLAGTAVLLDQRAVAWHRAAQLLRLVSNPVSASGTRRLGTGRKSAWLAPARAQRLLDEAVRLAPAAVDGHGSPAPSHHHLGATPGNQAVTLDIVRTHLLEHPAVQAWGKLNPERPEPVEIETLKRRKVKGAIYRLAGVGPQGSAVIAKRCLTATALIEHTIYAEVLPRLPLTALHCYGFVEDPDPHFRWLFLEDAGNEPYSPKLAEHRVLAAHWLGLLHTSATHVAAAASLPDRGPDHYLTQLRLARDLILRDLTNPALNANDLAALNNLVSRCHFLESNWDRVEKLCVGVPRTFVHGDFAKKNIRVRNTRDGITLLPFDWATAGWAVPAADLVKCPDTALYWSTVREHWPTLNCEDIGRMVNVGAVFRSLAAIYWQALSLKSPHVEWSVDNLRHLDSRLADSIQTLGL
jgi:aminoglycoside phosphotransferase (APT) family kinase protein